ncbi:glycosyltransferase [Pilimelia columellifera]|uniref:Glycosyltransferase n=1 Tax=Pilimelia columellifera subsp. columellifera TaxID=706583 RepID=A0ABN3MYN2_9ACTN
MAATITLWWTLHAWRTPQTLYATRFAPPDGSHGHTFSLLLPARHEEAVLAQTVRKLLQSRHQGFELILIVGHDDPATATVAHELAAEHSQVSVIVDHHAVKNKPKALNTALPSCTGDIVGVFDAEDQVHPDLLTHVDYAFRTTDATVVQGGVQLINFHSNWFSVRNCLEYFFWFRSRLHLQAQRGFIPLGGNTVFVRANTLREVGGWDPQCLAEDCDLGVRLSSIGCKVVVAYDALLVTREETPDTATALFKQRTRWNQGFLQVLRKGDWRQLPSRRQRLLARYTLASPFVQAFTGVTTLAGFTMAVLFNLPAGIALLSYLPLLPTVGNLFFEVIGLHDFGRQYGLRIRAVDYAKLIAGAPVYMLLLAGAATRAVFREWRGRRDWELTRHVGAHLLPDVPTPAAADA